ncbi:hypothetical protein CL628_03495 [bacterium]|nr:hypothetical protein [bacterium]
MSTYALNPALKILIVTNSLILLAGAMLGPIYALFVDDIGGSLLDVGWAGGVYALVAGITIYFSGRLSDKVKERELLVVAGYAILGVGFLLYLLVDSIWMLLITQAVIGFGEATYTPSFDALYSKNLNKKRAGSGWGAWEAMYYFTTAAGAILGGVIAHTYGFTPLFIIMAALCLISATYIYLLPRQAL